MIQISITYIVTAATVSAIVAGALLRLTRNWLSERISQSIRAEYQQKLETHKAELKGQNAVEIEKLRSSLSIAALERNIVFSKLHARRAKVIAEIYRLLRNTYDAISDYTKVFEPVGEPSRAERRQAAVAAYDELKRYYPTVIIFVPVAIAQKIESLDLELLNAFNRFAVMVDGREGGEDANEWFAVVEDLRNEIRATLESVANEFRLLLGDDPAEIAEHGDGAHDDNVQ